MSDNLEDMVIEDAFFPLLSITSVVLYPSTVVPLFVKHPESIAALEAAIKSDDQLFVVTQKNSEKEDIDPSNLYAVGTVATVLQHLRLPDGTIKVLVEGACRARAKQFYRSKDDYFIVLTELLQETYCVDERFKSMMRSVCNRFGEYIQLARKLPSELASSLEGITNPSCLADTVALHLPIKVDDKQKVLIEVDVNKRLDFIMMLLEREIDLVNLEREMQAEVRDRIEKSHRRFFLEEKSKVLEEERAKLGGRSPSNELNMLEDKIKKTKMSKEAKSKALDELEKLRLMPSMSAEAAVLRTHLDWLLKMPWNRFSKVSKSLSEARAVLDADHYGLELEKVNDRIMEYIAVQQRVKKMKGPILCFVGPPGVGKTSLARSIAKATNRKFVRMSLGGMSDEAEIRGFKPTYVASRPGGIVQRIAKVGVNNPVFLLDEIDKLPLGFRGRGDPASALLEVLDQEQNDTFNDYYLEVDYDISHVFFIVTANSLNIQPALLDRLEIIRLPGYTEPEKMKIARKHLLPKQMKSHQLKDDEIRVTQGALSEIIRYYTREAGVRELERQIAKICRKVVKACLINVPPKPSVPDEQKKKVAYVITQRCMEKYLGVRRFRYGLAELHSQIGQVYGLAWTEVGGELLTIEAVAVPGKGKSVYTGQLGDVMQESIQAATTVVRSRARVLGIADDFYSKYDIHIHVPEGATPKDGPSAGIGMCIAIVSALTQIPVRSDVAMTGEITLRGEVLPIGGLKEKLLAAIRSGIKRVIIPEENRKDLKEIPKDVLSALDIKLVKWIDSVLRFALTEMPKPIKQEATKSDLISNPAKLSGKQLISGTKIISEDRVEPI